MSLVQSKAGLQMVETIIRYLPRIVVCLEELAKYTAINIKYNDDIIHIAEDMDIRKQENINLSHRVKELETMLKGYQPRYE
jgi:hypothetical protein